MHARSNNACSSLLATAAAAAAWLLALAALSSAAAPAQEPAAAAVASCESVQAHFSDQPEIAATIGSRLRYDENLVLCAFENHTTVRRQSCCSEQSERAFEAQAWRDYNDSIYQETRDMRSLFTKAAGIFRDGFMDMVDRAETAARAALVDQFGPLTHSDQRALHRFFSDLRAALQERQQQPPLDEQQPPLRPSAEATASVAASALLDHLFARSFFRQHAHSFTRASGDGGSDFSDEYATCVRQARRSVAASGSAEAASGGYASRLGRGLSAGAGLLHALHLAAEMVQTAADRAPLTADCVKDIVKMSYCGSCYGQPVQRPCSEFCTDVLGVCMGELRRLERAWDSHLSVLRMLVEFTLRQGYVQTLLAAASDELIAGGARHMRGLYAGANAAILYDRVVSECGQPKIRYDEPVTAGGAAAAAPASVASSAAAAVVSGRHDTAAQELNIEVSKFLALLDTELRGFFGRLPPSICMTDRYYDTSAGRDCWDGLMTRSSGKIKRLEFLQELAPKPPPLESLEILKQKLAAVRKEYLDKFPRRDPMLSQDSDDGPDGSGAGSGAIPSEAERDIPIIIPKQINHIGDVQSLWICMHCGFLANPGRSASAEVDDKVEVPAASPKHGMAVPNSSASAHVTTPVDAAAIAPPSQPLPGGKSGNSGTKNAADTASSGGAASSAIVLSADQRAVLLLVTLATMAAAVVHKSFR